MNTKRAISISLDEDVVKQLDALSVNRSRYINSILRRTLLSSSPETPPWERASDVFREDVLHGRVPMPPEWAEFEAATGQTLK